jgi:hypothetical protein
LDRVLLRTLLEQSPCFMHFLHKNLLFVLTPAPTDHRLVRPRRYRGLCRWPQGKPRTGPDGAYAYRDYLGGCDANAYLDAEAQAERFRQGVWRWGNEVKPWDFRKQQRSN